MINKINSISVGIGVKNVTEASDWYKSLLGEGVEMMEPSPGVIEIQLMENVWLQLDDTGYLKLGGESSIIRLETSDIEQAHLNAKKLATSVEDIATVEGVVKYFDFQDPWGNRLSYYEVVGQ